MVVLSLTAGGRRGIMATGTNCTIAGIEYILSPTRLQGLAHVRTSGAF